MGASHHGLNCQRTKSTGRDSNPRRRITGAASSPLDDQCSVSVGPEGLEPSPGGLRVRCAAASTLIPSCVGQSARRESNPRPDPYKRSALTAELRAAGVGPEGLEPTPAGLKVRCAAVTPRPCAWSGVCVSIVSPSFLLLVLGLHPVVALRIELSATCSSDRFGQPALDYHLPTSSSIQSGWQDSNLRSRAPRARGSAATLHPAVVLSQNGRISARRSPAPRAGAIARLRYVLHSVARAGVEPAFSA